MTHTAQTAPAQSAQTVQTTGMIQTVLTRLRGPRPDADAAPVAGMTAGTTRRAATVVEVLTDPGLVDEVAMVVAATGRRLLRGLHSGTEGAAGAVGAVGSAGAAGTGAISGEDARFAARVAAGEPGRAVVLISDADAERCRALCRALEQEGTAVRLLRVGSGTGGGDSTGDSAGGTVLQLPEQAADLAETLGREDHPTVTVHGAVGGAGTSVFAAALAGVAADPAAGGFGTALLIDADPDTGGAVGLPAVLGMDRIDGHRWDGAGDGALTGTELLRRLPHAGEVAVLNRDRQGLPAPTAGPVPCPVVVDAGRVAPPALMTGTTGTTGTTGSSVASGSTGSALPGTLWRVLVLPASVPGAVAAAAALGRDPALYTVLRGIPDGQLSRDHAATLLGRAPDIWWEHDPFLAGEVDTGEFAPSRAGTATTAAAELWEHLTGRTTRPTGPLTRWTA